MVCPVAGTNVVSTYSRGPSGDTVSFRSTDGVPAHPNAGVSNNTSSPVIVTNAYMLDTSFDRSSLLLLKVRPLEQTMSLHDHERSTNRSLGSRHPTALHRGHAPNR